MIVTNYVDNVWINVDNPTRPLHIARSGKHEIQPKIIHRLLTYLYTIRIRINNALLRFTVFFHNIHTVNNNPLIVIKYRLLYNE